jgi:IS5 family transposase
VSVDTSVVDVPKQRNSRKENAGIKSGEVPEGWNEDQSRRQCQKDLDARWAKKNNETHCGYKNHIKSDNDTKLIRSWLVGAVNEHDSQCLSDLLSDGDESLHADSAASNC